MSEGKDSAVESAAARPDGRLPYEKPAVTWEQPLEAHRVGPRGENDLALGDRFAVEAAAHDRVSRKTTDNTFAGVQSFAAIGPTAGSSYISIPEIRLLDDTDITSGADLLIMDTQFDAGEYQQHTGWGHGCLDAVVALALAVSACGAAALRRP